MLKTIMQRHFNRSGAVASCYVKSLHLSTNTQLKLYGFSFSQPLRSILHLCLENKIPYEFVEIDVFKGQNRTASYLQISPTGLVPAITDGVDFSLTEAGAILTYLCEARNLTHWYPQGNARSCAKINFWLHWHHLHTRSSTREILGPALVPRAYTKQTPEHQEAVKKSFGKTLTFLNNYFITSKMPYLAHSSHPTIADLLVLPELDQHTPEGFHLYDYGPYPEVSGYIDRMRSALVHYDTVFKPVCDAAERYKAKQAKK